MYEKTYCVSCILFWLLIIESALLYLNGACMHVQYMEFVYKCSWFLLALALLLHVPFNIVFVLYSSNDCNVNPALF